MRLNLYVKQLRLREALSQKDMANRLSISLQSYYLLETRNIAGARILKKISESLELSITKVVEMKHENN